MGATARTVPVVFLALLGGAPITAQAPQDGAMSPIAIQGMETDPPSPATLHNNDHVYVRILFEARVPVRIRAEPYFEGKVSRGARMSGGSLFPPGTGEAIAWFDFGGVAGVDSIHVSASRDGFRGEVASQNVEVAFKWDGQPSTGETRAAWVNPLLAEERQRQQDAFTQMEAASRATGSGGVGMVIVGVFGIVALGALGACAVWPIWGVVRWRGNWRIAAAVPLAAVVLWGLKDAIDLANDPTSHNLLPFEFIEAAVAVVPYMLVVTIWRASALRKAAKAT